MGDAAAPQNSINAGTSMRMSVKVKYAHRCVLKDATQGSERQQRATEGMMRGEKKGKRGERKKKKGKIMCLYYAA